MRCRWTFIICNTLPAGCNIFSVCICTCRNRNVAAATRSDKSTLTLIVLTFSKPPVSIIAPLVISTNLQATSRNLLLGKIPIVRCHLGQVNVVIVSPLATYSYQANILKLCRILVGKFCPLISHGREVGCECIVSILLRAHDSTTIGFQLTLSCTCAITNSRTKSIIPIADGSEKNSEKFKAFETIFWYSSLLFCPR